MIERLSRRGLLRRSAVTLCVAAMGGVARRAAADEEIKEADKVTQKEALYQNHPKGQQRCEICLQFNPPNHCKIVQGPIVKTGWCQYFAARENAR
ncbi:MAG TPA: hypothetical protein VET85_10950 [Stellaceae bacterium]|nr:hypothetical protein [Stellaceae bacterium]